MRICDGCHPISRRGRQGLVPKNFVSKYREGGSCSWTAQNVGEHYGSAYRNDSEVSVPLLLNNKAPAYIDVFAALAKAILFRECYCGFAVFVYYGGMIL